MNLGDPTIAGPGGFSRDPETICQSSACYQTFAQLLCGFSQDVAELNDSFEFVRGLGTKLTVVWSAHAKYRIADKLRDGSAELGQHWAELANVEFISNFLSGAVSQSNRAIEFDSICPGLHVIASLRNSFVIKCLG